MCIKDVISFKKVTDSVVYYAFYYLSWNLQESYGTVIFSMSRVLSSLLCEDQEAILKDNWVVSHR